MSIHEKVATKVKFHANHGTKFAGTTGGPFNTFTEDEIVAVLIQWEEWREVLGGVDPAKAVAALKGLRDYLKGPKSGKMFDGDFYYSSAVMGIIEKAAAILPPEPEKAGS